jgi:hypothetical protein
MKVNGKFFRHCLFCAAIGLASNLNLNQFHSKASSKLTPERQPTNQFTDYRNWLRANKKPVRMQASISAMCAPAAAARQKNDGPHNDKFIVVYVNRPGQKGMMEELHPRFPEGSVIVKEKLTSAGSTSPELLTAMLKREKGFNPAGNDWEFFVLSGDAKTIREQGKLENCLACHTAKRNDDFVFRNYLPSDVPMKWK